MKGHQIGPSQVAARGPTARGNTLACARDVEDACDQPVAGAVPSARQRVVESLAISRVPTEVTRPMLFAIRVAVQPALSPVAISARSAAVSIHRVPATAASRSDSLTRGTLLGRYDTALSPIQTIAFEQEFRHANNNYESQAHTSRVCEGPNPEIVSQPANGDRGN